MDWTDWRKRLKAHMKSKKITQDEVAEKMDLTQGAVAHWFSARRKINLEDFFTLCEFARADPQTILFGKASDVNAGVEKLDALLAEHPNLRALIANRSAANAAVERAAGPLPRAHKPRRSPTKRRKIRQ